MPSESGRLRHPTFQRIFGRADQFGGWTFGALLMGNDNWRDDQLALIEGTIYQPTDDRESVIVATLPQGAAYTAIVSGKAQTTGVGLVELYDSDHAVDAQLANISTRGLVQTGDNLMIGGFILGGSTAETHVAVRGIGPSIQSVVPGGNVLADPTLELRDGNGALLIANDNWQDDPASATQLTIQGLALQNPERIWHFCLAATERLHGHFVWKERWHRRWPGRDL